MSQELRFCSRCGFQLRAVSQLLTTGGLLPGLEYVDDELTQRQKGMRLGAKVLFASFVTIPLTIALSAIVDHPLPLLLTFLLFFTGVARMLYARLFELDRKRLAAPPPAPMLGRGRTTGELPEQPPSVTEHTTRFLDQ